MLHIFHRFFLFFILFAATERAIFQSARKKQCESNGSRKFDGSERGAMLSTAK
jgi:hypothetical protein